MVDTDESRQLTTGATITTLVVTDLVDSTKLVEQLGDERAFYIFSRHDRVARDLLQQYKGREIDKTDGFLLLFERPIDALAYAVAYHQALAELSSSEGTPVSSRVGIHLGEVYLRENRPEDVARGAKPLEVEGLAKPMTARLMSLALGGQTLLTQGAFDLARRAAVGGEQAGPELQWLAHGAYRFKGVEQPVPVFEAGVVGAAPLTPPPGSEKVIRITGDETVLGWRPAPGLEMPQRPNWRIVAKLGEGGFGEVWLAAHSKTGEQRVFKFCFDVERLQGLQREVTLFRLLKDALGSRPDIARIIDWSFDQAPYFVESEYTEGGSLLDWARRHDGITAMPLASRLTLMAQVAGALAAAHSVGILHKDLKPANVLVHGHGPDQLQARLTDFGIGRLTDPSRLSDAGITVLGFTHTLLDDETAMTGTQLYMAPEQLEGKVPTVQADIYALGVMLYQMVVGDLQRALAPGWERDIDDELLREDIAALVDGSPERRLGDAGEAARRLSQLEQRRRQREEEAQARWQAEQARIALERAKKRRKLVAMVVAVLAIFAVAMGIQSWRIAREAERAEREAERAEREAETATEVSRFLLGIFEKAKPEQARGEALSARELVDQGAADIEQELAGQPEVLWRLTQMLGNVYFSLGSYDQAEHYFSTSISMQRAQQGRVDAGVATGLMNLAVIRGQKGRLDEARSLLEQALVIKEQALGPEHPEIADLLSNLAVVNRAQGHYDEALTQMQRALQVVEQTRGPDHHKVAIVLTNLANLYRDQGRYHEAEAALQRALTILHQAVGEDHPEVASVRSSLAAVARALGRPDEAESLYRQVLELRRQQLGEQHPLVAQTRCRLAEVLLEQNDQTDEAEPLLSQALAAIEASLGAQHQAVAEIVVPLAEVRRRQHRYAEAAQLLQRARSIVEQHFGPENAALVPALCCQARIDTGQGRAATAAGLLEQALQLAEQAHGPDHAMVGQVAEQLAAVYQQLGRTAEAGGLTQRAARIREALQGPAAADRDG